MPHAFVRAMLVYSSEPCERTFAEDLNLHLVYGGYVLSRPDVFVMMRPVQRDAGRELIVDPHIVFPRDKCDCWHVYLLAGQLAVALPFLPYPLPWFSWEVQNVLRFGRADLVQRLISLPHDVRKRLPQSPSCPSGGTGAALVQG